MSMPKSEANKRAWAESKGDRALYEKLKVKYRGEPTPTAAPVAPVTRPSPSRRPASAPPKPVDLRVGHPPRKSMTPDELKLAHAVEAGTNGTDAQQVHAYRSLAPLLHAKLQMTDLEIEEWSATGRDVGWLRRMLSARRDRRRGPLDGDRGHLTEEEREEVEDCHARNHGTDDDQYVAYSNGRDLCRRLGLSDDVCDEWLDSGFGMNYLDSALGAKRRVDVHGEPAEAVQCPDCGLELPDEETPCPDCAG